MIDFQNPCFFPMLSFFSCYAGGVNSGSSGRREAEGKEADDEEKQQHIDRQQRQPETGAAHFKAAGQKKGQQDADNKDQNIQRQKIPPQQSGVSEKSGRDKKHSNADRQKPGREKMPGGLIQHDDFKKGIEQHRKNKSFKCSQTDSLTGE